MRRIRITLSYDGTDYHGWQLQPGLPTIQGVVESVLAEIESAPVKVEGSGRTDAGVHALAQVAAFSLENSIPTANLEKAMNRFLPRDIRRGSARKFSSPLRRRFENVRISHPARRRLLPLRAPVRAPSSLPFKGVPHL